MKALAYNKVNEHIQRFSLGIEGIASFKRSTSIEIEKQVNGSRVERKQLSK
jgi:hypothetical protein